MWGAPNLDKTGRLTVSACASPGPSWKYCPKNGDFFLFLKKTVPSKSSFPGAYRTQCMQGRAKIIVLEGKFSC